MSSPPDPRTVLRQRLASSPTLEFVVTVATGASRGAQVVVDAHRPSRVLVGHSPACDLLVQDSLVSRRHLAMEVCDGRLRLVDLDSRNGTRVGGVLIKEAFVVGGQPVEVGETILLVEPRRATPSKRTATDTFGKLVGGSDAMTRLFPLCHSLAASDVPVVLEGETGTGKEVLAESLHEAGPRAAGPFVVFDCTAVPANLMESALFGHERGAFTGANETRPGIFEEADGGTLFIDEIGDLALELQAKLLRALEKYQVRRIGGKTWRTVNVRVLAATRRDLDNEVQAGRFRDDLFYRLAVGRIELPPLRERRGDIELLARHFWARIAGRGRPIPEDFLERLKTYSWPGNVRELQNTVARRVALGDGVQIGLGIGMTKATATGIDGAIASILDADLPLPRARELAVAEFERRYLERILEKHGGSVKQAAAASGLALRYFQLLRARTRKSE
ncbi:MAG: sigma 54-interacting transcriptional regulator [Deltaproteobacteria bacterium]|nr:sigma 54-interacting transcriptional regulator [Deltaproteobacteria bacterium]